MQEQHPSATPGVHDADSRVARKAGEQRTRVAAHQDPYGAGRWAVAAYLIHGEQAGNHRGCKSQAACEVAHVGPT